MDEGISEKCLDCRFCQENLCEDVGFYIEEDGAPLWHTAGGTPITSQKC